MLESDSYTFIKEKEIYFIALYKRTVDGGTLANITTGGDGTHGFNRTPEINKIIADKTRGVNNSRSKKCYQYDSEGNFIKEWDSFNMAATAIGAKKQNVLKAKDEGIACRSFYWSDIKYTNFIKESEVYKNRIESVKNSYYVRPVIAYNDEGDVLNFESAVEAITYFTGSTKNKTNIMFALFGRYKKAYGYTFKYAGPLRKRGS